MDIFEQAFISFSTFHLLHRFFCRLGVCTAYVIIDDLFTVTSCKIEVIVVADMLDARRSLGQPLDIVAVHSVGFNQPIVLFFHDIKNRAHMTPLIPNMLTAVYDILNNDAIPNIQVVAEQSLGNQAHFRDRNKPP